METRPPRTSSALMVPEPFLSMDANVTCGITGIMRWKPLQQCLAATQPLYNMACCVVWRASNVLLEEPWSARTQERML